MLYTRNTFQSTQPEWAATHSKAIQRQGLSISIHAARVGCDAIRCMHEMQLHISIHAARVGCDAKAGLNLFRVIISIHAARVGCDRKDFNLEAAGKYFNPRSPSGLRPAGQRPCRRRADFNPRSPSGLRQRFYCHPSFKQTISIHAARVGCDQFEHYLNQCVTISIHAARVGCDL